MVKFSKRFKKRHNKTKKRLKGGNNDAPINIEDAPREGVLDIVGDKIGELAGYAAQTIEDTGLKVVGLERIQKEGDNVKQSMDENMKKIGETAKQSLSYVTDVANNASQSAIKSVNEVIGSDVVKEGVKKAADETVAISEKLLENFNDTLNDPKLKQDLNEAIDHAGEIGTVVVEAAREPFNKAVDIAAEAFPKATSAAMAGLVKVGTDMMAAVPGVGSVIEVGKILNDSSKAASAVVEAGSEAVEAGSDLFIDTKENIEKGMEELEAKKKLGDQITNRATQSIQQFEHPTQNATTSIMKGGSKKKKTKRGIFRRKRLSKRVKFLI